jgi:ATP-dependent Zn protease
VVQEALWPGTVERATTRAGGALAGSVMVEIGHDTVDAEWVRMKLVMLLAGRAAEHELGEPSGASGGPEGSDLALATTFATIAQTALGMSGKLLWLGAPNPEEAARILCANPAIAASVNAWLDAAYAEARRMVADRWNAVQAVADALLAREVLSGAEVREIIARSAAPPDGQPQASLPGSTRTA